MNAPNQVGGAQAQTTRGGGRGRSGRGGRGGHTATTQRAPPAKAVKGKIGPARLLETEWVKDGVMKDSAFVIWLGTGTSAQQWTFHRPIGETTLDGARDWVATPTRDIEFLLERRNSEELTAWNRRRELAVRTAVLAARTGREKIGDAQAETWAFNGAPAIQPTIRTCQAAAKAAGSQESAWLDYADQAVRTAEQSFKQALRTQEPPAEWVRDNPRPTHETRGGPLADQPQTAVPYLTGKSRGAAETRVLQRLLGIAVQPDADPAAVTKSVQQLTLRGGGRPPSNRAGDLSDEDEDESTDSSPEPAWADAPASKPTLPARKK